MSANIQDRSQGNSIDYGMKKSHLKILNAMALVGCLAIVGLLIFAYYLFGYIPGGLMMAFPILFLIAYKISATNSLVLVRIVGDKVRIKLNPLWQATFVRGDHIKGVELVKKHIVISRMDGPDIKIEKSILEEDDVDSMIKNILSLKGDVTGAN